jgi:hypothetical protein
VFAALDDVYARVAERREFEVIEIIERDTVADTGRVVFSVYPTEWGVVCYTPLLTKIGDIEAAAAK